MGRLLSRTRGLQPPPDLSPSEWAESYRYLSPEDSAEPGKYRGRRAPYQKGILDALKVSHKIVLMCSAQVGKTLCQTNALAYWIDHAPAPILWVAPTIQMAEATSKEKIQPMIRDTPAIAKLIDDRSRTAGNTILQKKFPGGQLTLAGANSPASLASRSIRYLLVDELDRFPLSAGIEGDPYKLASKRTTAYWNSVEFLVSTPTIAGVSRIAQEFELSDQRHFYLPCPHCGHYQHLIWDQLQYEGKGTKEAKLNDGDWLGYFCGGCGALIEEPQKMGMLRLGEWRSHRESRTVGFHINELCSPFRSWRDVARDFEEARNDPSTFQVWWNTSLGLPFEVAGRTHYRWEDLLARAENSSYSLGEIPEKVLLLTAGVDVQGDRLEVSVLGWAEGEEFALISHHKIYGDTLEPEVWDALEDFLDRQYDHPLGGKISVTRAAIDTGFQSQDCYQQIRQRKSRTRGKWLAIKGKEGDRPAIATPSNQDVNWRGKKVKRGIQLYILGVDKIKQTLLSRAQLDRPGPKYLNVPINVSADWCEQFAGSEIMVKKHKGSGYTYAWEPVSNVRNEGLDCAVYAYAAALHVGLERINWEKLRRSLTVADDAPAIAASKPTPEPTPEAPPKSARPRRQRPHRNSFIHGR